MTPHSITAPGRRIGHAVLRTQSDERLVTLARAGSEPAFEAIVARYRRPLERYCARIVGEARAEDVVQDAILRAYVSIGRGEDVRTLRPWLYRIAHNTSLNQLRHRSAEAVLDERLPGGEAPEQAMERREGLHAAVAAVRALPLRQRDAIVLRELEGRSYDEIAGELGVTRGAARQLLSRARTSVRAGVTALVPASPLIRLIAPLGDGAAAARLAEVGGGGAVPKLAAMTLAAGALAVGSGELPPQERPATAPQTQSAGIGGGGGDGQARLNAASSVRPAGAVRRAATRATSTSTPRRAAAFERRETTTTRAGPARRPRRDRSDSQQRRPAAERQAAHEHATQLEPGRGDRHQVAGAGAPSGAGTASPPPAPGPGPVGATARPPNGGALLRR